MFEKINQDYEIIFGNEVEGKGRGPKCHLISPIFLESKLEKEIENEREKGEEYPLCGEGYVLALALPSEKVPFDDGFLFIGEMDNFHFFIKPKNQIGK